jgi:periplasmic copper chaperone A
MSKVIRRRVVLHSGLAVGVALLAPAARACEFFGANLRVMHPWTRATAEGATTAQVNLKFDQVTQDDRLIGVETPVAEAAEVAGAEPGAGVDISIPAGETTLLGEGGAIVRLVGLKMPLELGRSYPMKLVFDKGGVIDATLNVDYTSFRFR